MAWDRDNDAFQRLPNDGATTDPSHAQPTLQDPATPWHVRRGIIFSAVAGGLFLWMAGIAAGGKPVYVLVFGFFIAIPVMMAISAVAVLILILPVAGVLNLCNRLNPATLTVCGAATGMWVLVLYSNKPSFSEKFSYGWWGLVWMGGMALIFAVTALPPAPVPKSDEQEPDGR